jgi:ORF6N domain
MFQLNLEQFTSLRSQFVISNVVRGGRHTPPYAFTEQGVAMLSTVLSSARAQFKQVFDALRELSVPTASTKRPIGFIQP